jgi:hypothetical protein
MYLGSMIMRHVTVTRLPLTDFPSMNLAGAEGPQQGRELLLRGPHSNFALCADLNPPAESNHADWSFSLLGLTAAIPSYTWH